jgi:hypothetical protein
MIRSGGSLKAAASAVALGLTLAPVVLLAQSESGWRLPGATVKPAPPGSQGPVDRDNPVVTTAAPRETATPTPSPAPSPTASQPAPTASAAIARPSATPATRPVTAQAPRPGQGAASGPAVQPGSAVVPADAGLAGPAAQPLQTDFAASPPPAATPALVDPAATPGWYWPWIAAATALLAAVFALLWWRRRKVPAVAAIAFERPIVPAPQPAAAPAKPEPIAPAPRALPEPHLSIALPAGLGMTLEARRMSASLMATTLSYVVTLTNTGTEPLSALAVEGDMVSAHASLPPEQQIAGDGQRLELRHALVALAPGESAEFIGDFRLPLAAVTPIRAGEAAYFVPLARLRVEASTAAGQSLVQVQTYVVGELPEAQGAALRPFRLDLGPRTYSRIGQRAVN